MKKKIWLLLVMILVTLTGCKAEEAKEQVEVTDEITDAEVSGAEVSGGDVSEDENSLDDYMASIREASDAVKHALEYESLTQTDMNIKSQELYELWDGALNDLWAEVKMSLSDEEFEKLLDEQRAWITEKESKAAEAGKEVEGGSMYPMIVNMEAARMTEERVYVLYDILKQ